MKIPATNLGEWVIKKRWWVILVTLVIVISAASGGRFLTFTNSYRIFFSADNPQLLAFEALEKTFTKNDNVMFVLEPKSGEVFTRKTLTAVEELTEKAWQIPHSSRVDSLSNFQHTSANGDDLVVRDLIEEAHTLKAEELARIRSVAEQEPLLLGNLFSTRGHVTAVNVTIQLPGKDETRETPEVADFARNLATEIEQTYPDITVHLTGMVMMNNAFGEMSRSDMKSLVLISFGMMVLALVFLLGSVSGAVVTVIVILFSIVSAMGLGGYLGFPLTAPSASAPTMILTMAIANSVHVLVSFIHEMRHGKEKRDAIVESIRINFQPVFLASLTTCLGFLSMNFSDAPPFRHLGNFVAMGVAVSFVLSVTLLPALMSLLPVRVKPVKEGEVTTMARLGEFVVKKRTFLLWGMMAVIISLIAFIPKNQLNDVFVEYFDETVPFRVDSDFTTDNLTGIYNIEYSLVASEPGGISEPSFLRDVEAFSNWYRSQPEVMHVTTLTDIMRRLNKNMHGDNQDWYRLPEVRDLSAQYLLLYEMSLPYGLDLNNQINIDKSAIRVTVSCKTISSNEVLDLERRSQAWLAENTSSINLEKSAGTGPTMMFANIGQRNIKSMLTGTTLALVLISMVLIIALRSWKIGLISLLPNLVPAAMGFGLWGLLVGEVGLALSVVTGMTLGIVVDDTVHFLSKYLRAKRENGMDSPTAVVYAFKTVGKALWVTSVVLIIGFLILSLSSFELNAGMGLLTAIVISFALLADFLFLPPLLMKFEEKYHD